METGHVDFIDNTQPHERSMKLIEDAGLYVLTVCFFLSSRCFNNSCPTLRTLLIHIINNIRPLRRHNAA